MHIGTAFASERHGDYAPLSLLIETFSLGYSPFLRPYCLDPRFVRIRCAQSLGMSSKSRELPTPLLEIPRGRSAIHAEMIELLPQFRGDLELPLNFLPLYTCHL